MQGIFRAYSSKMYLPFIINREKGLILRNFRGIVKYDRVGIIIQFNIPIVYQNDEQGRIKQVTFSKHVIHRYHSLSNGVGPIVLFLSILYGNILSLFKYLVQVHMERDIEGEIEKGQGENRLLTTWNGSYTNLPLCLPLPTTTNTPPSIFEALQRQRMHDIEKINLYTCMSQCHTYS